MGLRHVAESAVDGPVPCVRSQWPGHYMYVSATVGACVLFDCCGIFYAV